MKIFVTRIVPEAGIKMLKDKGYEIAVNPEDRVLTKEELEEPDEIMSTERIERVAKGAGITSGEVRDLLKQYKTVKKMMKMMKGKTPDKMMKKLKLPGM